MNLEAVLAAIEQAKSALDQIEMEAAAQQPPEEEAPPAPEEGADPSMPPMPRKPPMMG